MAIDLSTHIAGKTSPEGVLYSAGRDGLVIAWELGAPTKRRRQEHWESTASRRVQRQGDWKAMTGWDDDQDLSDDESSSSGEAFALDLNEGVLDGVSGSTPRVAISTRTAHSRSMPYERRWQIDSHSIDDIEPVRLPSMQSHLQLR
jgi:WD repeat-containing protein 48